MAFFFVAMKYLKTVCIVVKLTDGSIYYAIGAKYTEKHNISFTTIYGHSLEVSLTKIHSMTADIVETRPVTAN